ncbi:MAG: glycosyltransferase family 39 protein [Candidatus Andersenbacteria bacterium]|nr:glycosyltransferase family 39 protein [Candidatus Andersenbacteria bacterium]MBI3250233.1 glycosyltransferase family 39 protein [Candidatus Andersenbacteria bacterium]
MRTDKATIFILFTLFCLANVAFLNRVPGLLGDEASEGENVYELLTNDSITVVGERSYIGPAIDYVRVPFAAVFGYTTLALRIPMFIFSVATFWLAWSVLKKQFGETTALYALTLLTFSPVYVLYQRLGWAITLFPFFTFLIIWLAQQSWRTKWLWVGVAAGLGLANHILFLPILVGFISGYITFAVVRRLLLSTNRSTSSQSLWHTVLLGVITACVGFWAGFGMQFAVLQLHTDDQGSIKATTQLFSERVSDFISAAPLYISGSSYVAQYMGQEFTPSITLLVVIVLLVLVGVAIILNWRNPYLWAYVLGLVLHLSAMLYMIDRFNLRYFTTFALGIWLLAGMGLGSILRRVPKMQIGVPPLAVLLLLWLAGGVLIPFLHTGGAVAEFSLGNRTNDAAAFVDTRPLISCLRGKGPLYSENIHIWNRLQYLSHYYDDLVVVPEDRKREATVQVAYMDPKISYRGGICPDLQHFQVGN